VLSVEAVNPPLGGKGLQLTGKWGDVMKESAQTAYSYIWSQAQALGIYPDEFHHYGVHVHVPAGTIPKDGPSAGVAIACSLVSWLTGKPVHTDTAMTGGITLAGLVSAVGGDQGKLLAAHRVGIRGILLPAADQMDLATLDSRVRDELECIPVKNLQEVFAAAFAPADSAWALQSCPACSITSLVLDAVRGRP